MHRAARLLCGSGCANGDHSVTLATDGHGKLSIDGRTLSESRTVTVKDGQTLREALSEITIEAQADYAYAFDHFSTHDTAVTAAAVGNDSSTRFNVLVDRYGRVWLGGLNTHGQLGTEERLGVTDESRETRENPAGTAHAAKRANRA